jgi:hypothetical protein
MTVTPDHGGRLPPHGQARRREPNGPPAGVAVAPCPGCSDWTWSCCTAVGLGRPGIRVTWPLARRLARALVAETGHGWARFRFRYDTAVATPRRLHAVGPAGALVDVTISSHRADGLPAVPEAAATR